MKPSPRRASCVAAGLSVLLLTGMFGPLPAAHAQADQDVINSAAFLLRSGTIADRQNRYHVLLRALRHLEDPLLAPLYTRLIESENNVMKIHGMLGLAEVSSPRALDLNRFMSIKDPVVQSELLGAAMDSDLIDAAASKQLLAWKSLDPGAKLVIAARLVENKQFNDAAMVRDAADTDQIARKGIAGMLLVQLQDPMGPKLLAEIDASTDPARDAVRALMLESAFRYELDRIGPWAMAIANEKAVNDKLELMAIRTAMRFRTPGADALWRQRFVAATDAAQQVRLALALLNLAPWIDPAPFDALAASKDAFLQTVGRSGKAVASKSGVAGAVEQLIRTYHPIVTAWVLIYAEHFATGDDAKAILKGLIRSYDDAPARRKSQQLDAAIRAAELLFERDADHATTFLAELLADDDTDDRLRQGLLVGLIRVNRGSPHRAVAGLDKPFADGNANGLKLLLEAKNGVRLDADQLQTLGLLVRGGGGLPDALRVQAAWTYLKQIGQAEATLTTALK